MKYKCIGSDEYQTNEGPYTVYTFNDGSIRVEPGGNNPPMSDAGFSMTSRWIDFVVHIRDRHMPAYSAKNKH